MELHSNLADVNSNGSEAKSVVLELWLTRHEPPVGYDETA
jgi:hypothetical protein